MKTDNKNSTAPGVSLPILRTLKKMGKDLKSARLRRRIPSTLLAERASISRTTLMKIEKGDPGVSLGNYSQVMFALGLLNRLDDLLDVRHDEVGLMLEEEQLPKRVRSIDYRVDKPR